MILKIREPVARLKPIKNGPHEGECLLTPDGWRWFVFGDLEEVNWHDRHYRQDSLTGEDGPPVVHVDRWFVHPSPKSEEVFQVVTITSIHGKTQTFAFNTDAYLCNNQGDTVEKITVGKFISWGAQGDGPPPERVPGGFVEDVVKNSPKEHSISIAVPGSE